MLQYFYRESRKEDDTDSVSTMRMMNKKGIKKALLACVALMAVMALLLCGCSKSDSDNDKDSGNKKNPGSSKEPVQETVTSTDLVEQATAMYGDLLSLYKDVVSGESKSYNLGTYIFAFTSLFS